MTSSKVKRVIVIAPQMEQRSLPKLTLKPVNEKDFIPCEAIIKRIGKELYGAEVEILGLPWISRFNYTVSLDFLLEDSYLIYQVIQTSFFSESPSDGVVIIADKEREPKLLDAKEKVLPKLSSKIPQEQTLWICLKTNYKDMLGSEEPNLEQANKIKLPDANETIKALCESLQSLFK